MPRSVLDEASELHRFLQPIARLVKNAHEDHPYYPEATYAFFRYIGDLIGATLTYLEGLPSRPGNFPAVGHSIRQKLKLLRHSWGLLHRYVKPSLDADALHVPLALLNAFGDQLRKVEGCEQFQFAIFQLATFNYIMITQKQVNRVADSVAAIVRMDPFPPDLSLVGIPYTQSAGLFLNFLIPHEMGHFVYQQRLRGEITSKVDEILTSSVALRSDAPAEELLLSRVMDLLTTWVEEIFCDLFAISLIGPAFSLAYSELTAAYLIADNLGSRSSEVFEFASEHPADVARFHLHLKHLRALGWWKYVRKWNSPLVGLLKECSRFHESCRYSQEIPPEVCEHLALKHFWTVCDWLGGFVCDRIAVSSGEPERMGSHYSVISSYLSNAVVPSSIVVEGEVMHPTTVELVNSAYRFVHEDFDKLLRNIEKVSSSSVGDRSRYQERLELWILKALEDNRMLAAEQGAKRGSA